MSTTITNMFPIVAKNTYGSSPSNIEYHTGSTIITRNRKYYHGGMVNFYTKELLMSEGYSTSGYLSFPSYVLYNNYVLGMKTSGGDAYFSYNYKNNTKYANHYYYARMCVYSPSSINVDMYWSPAAAGDELIVGKTNQTNAWTMVSEIRKSTNTKSFSGFRIDNNTSGTSAIYDGCMVIDVTSYLNGNNHSGDISWWTRWFDTHAKFNVNGTVTILDSEDVDYTSGKGLNTEINSSDLSSITTKINSGLRGRSNTIVNNPTLNSEIDDDYFSSLVNALNTRNGEGNTPNDCSGRGIIRRPITITSSKTDVTSNIISSSNFQKLSDDINNMSAQGTQSNKVTYRECGCEGNSRCDCDDVCGDCSGDCNCDGECTCDGDCGCNNDYGCTCDYDSWCSCDGDGDCTCNNYCYCDNHCGCDNDWCGCYNDYVCGCNEETTCSCDTYSEPCVCNNVCSCNWV